MKVHITNLYGQSADSTALIAQNMVAKIAQQLGISEAGIYNYPVKSDTAGELTKRLDGIFASFAQDDIMIFQTPTWNDLEFDQALINHVKAYRDSKLIIFVHDVIALMFESNRYLLSKLIAAYNQADVLILPSENMRRVLVKHGLQVKKVLIQGVWDHLYDCPQWFKPPFKRQLSFIGNPQKFSFINDWSTAAVPIRLYAAQPAVSNPAITYAKPLPDVALLPDLQQNGGFGLVWGTDRYWHEYMMYSTSFKLGTYLAAGLPVVVDASNANADLVRQNHLGLVVVSLDEAAHQIQTLSAADYQELCASVDQFAELLRQGYFTKHVLIDAIFYLLQAPRASQLYALQTSQQFQPRFLNIQQTLTHLESSSLINLSLADIQLLHSETSQPNAAAALAHELLNIVNLPAGQPVLLSLPQPLTQTEQETFQVTFNAAFYGDGRLNQPFANFPLAQATEIYQQLQQLWEKQDLLLLTERHLETNLFAQAASVAQIVCSPRISAAQLAEIKAAAKQKLVLVLLGSAGHRLAAVLATTGQQVLDFGAQLVEDYANFTAIQPN